MKSNLLLTISIIVVPAWSVPAIDDFPDTAILQNKFIDLVAVGEGVVALSDNMLTFLEWDESLNPLVPVWQAFLLSPAMSMKMEGALLIVRHSNDELSFYNSSTFPELERLGTVSPHTSYYDFAYIEGNLYLSRWFEGIDRYLVPGFDSLLFLSNDKSAVAATQLASDFEKLYALDMYNGVLKYNLEFGFGSDVKLLLVNERPFAFSIIEDLVFISKNAEGVIIGKFSEGNGETVQEIVGVPSPRKVLTGEEALIFLSPRRFDVFDNSFELDFSYQFDNNLVAGAIHNCGDSTLLLLPSEENGITRFELSGNSGPSETLYRPGTVKAALIHQGYLFNGGDGNPLEAYQIENDRILESILLRGENTGVTDLAIWRNRLYALYAGEQKVIEFDIENLDNMVLPIDSFSVSIDDASGLNTYKLSDNSTQLLTVKNKYQIELFEKTSESFESAAVWNFDKPFADTKIKDDKLFVTDRFETISAYTIESDYSLTKCSERNLTGTGLAMEEYGSKLYVFTGNTLTIFDDCLVLDTIVRLTSSVLDAEIENDTLYTVGQDGIAKYDLSGGLPALVDKGGLKGSQISVDNGNIATTDGSSIDFYFGTTNESDEEENLAQATGLKLYENFPEPFNSSTTIQFELASSSHVELSIYNLLGQRVRVLKEETFAAGRHSVSWNGKDDFGSEVSSGIYFYRLLARTESVSKKMMLIK